MLKLIRTFTLILTTALVAFTSEHAQWTIADNYEVQFSGSGADGTFKGLEGTINFDPDNPEQAQFDVTLDARTIETGNKTKNKHARGESWFAVEQYPQIHFRSEKIKASGEEYQMTGTLTLHGVKKEISFPFTFYQEGNTGLFEGSFTVDREEYGIEGPFFGFMVGDDFKVDLYVPVKK